MQNPILFTTRLIALALLGHIALSWPLWHAGYRAAFPVLPVFGLPFPQTDFWSALHAWVTVGICLALLWLPNRRWVLAATIAWFLWMIAQDITRFQPWMYFYLLALGLILCGAGHLTQRREAVKEFRKGLRASFASLREIFVTPQNSLRWLLAAVYCWGGFNKLTPYFAEDNFPWFCEVFFWTKPLGAWPAAGYGVALAELLFAPGLLWGVTRPVFRWIVPGFHLFIIAALSPPGLDWNTVVIPWNVAMGGMVWVIFGPSPRGEGGSISLYSSYPKLGWIEESENKSPSPLGEGPGVGLLALAWLMPLFNIFHLWPEPLSWKMYSNTQTEATFYRDTGTGSADPLQHVWHKHAYDKGRKLLLDDWAFDELHVPAWNNRLTFIQLSRYLCAQNKRPGDSGLLLLSVNRWDKSAEKEETIPCAQIAR